jgi:adenylate kinase family enzyme
MRDICLLGLPGAGKGTFLQRLEKIDAEGEIAMVSTGDIARSISEETVRTGAFAPEDKFREALFGWLDETRQTYDRIILEGFPRTFEQLVLAEKICNNPLYVVLETPVITCIQRLHGRGRIDDTPENIARRLTEHRINIDQIVRAVQSGPRGRVLTLTDNSHDHVLFAMKEAGWIR